MKVLAGSISMGGFEFTVAGFDQNCTDSTARNQASVFQISRSWDMFTAAECRVRAEEKLAQAACDDRHRRRLNTAAEAWLILASQMRRLEAKFADGRSACAGGRT
jgi:hypothetical protein